MYYLITSAEYDTHHADAVDHAPVYSLDGTKCIIHVSNEYVCENHIMSFLSAHDVNAWRFDSETEEWRNWETEEDHYGQ